QAMADRYSYVPLIGPFVIVAWMACELARRAGPMLPTVLASVALATLTGVAWVQVGYWRDTNTLFSHTVRVNPDNWLGWHQLGLFAVSRNELDRADEMYERALRARPGSALVHCNYANNLVRQNRPAEAEEHFRKALASEP